MRQPTSTTTLLERIGGRPTLEAAIDELYTRLLEDEYLNRFFKGVDLRWLKIHQKQFLTAAFTTTEFDLCVALTRLRKAHANLCQEKGLNEKHFDAVAMHLIETLQGLGLAEDVIEEVASTVAPLRFAFTSSNSPKRKKRTVKKPVKSWGFLSFRRMML